MISSKSGLKKSREHRFPLRATAVAVRRDVASTNDNSPRKSPARNRVTIWRPAASSPGESTYTSSDPRE